MVAPIILPELLWVSTQAKGSRMGEKVVRVVLHRWGARYTTEKAEALSYKGVINEFENTANQASSHVVYPGSAAPGATQMVPWSQKAWTEADYNASSVEIESADAIWLGHDPHGLAQLARMTAFLLYKYNLPAIHSISHGFCRHGDLGIAGGGHTVCPTTATAPIWKAFCSLVQHEAHRGGFRPKDAWGRE